MRFTDFERGEPSSESDDYGHLVESSKQAERRLKHSSKNPMKPKSYSKSFTHKNTVHRSSSPNFKNHMKHKSGSKKTTHWRKTLPESSRRQTLKRPRPLSSSSDDDDDDDGESDAVVGMRGFSGQKHGLEKGDCKRRKLHPSEGDGFVVDPDYVLYLKTLEDCENEIVDCDEDSIEQEEEEEEEEEDDRNDDIHVDMDGKMDIHVDVDREMEMDDDVHVNVDREMERDVNGIDVGDDPDPEYKMFLENLREDGKSYVLEMTTEKGKSVFIKYEEPLPVQIKKKVQTDDLGVNLSHEGKRGFATKKICKEGPSNHGLEEMPSTSLPPRPSKSKATPINDSHQMLPPPEVIKRKSSAINHSRSTPLLSKGIKRNSTPINNSHPTEAPSEFSNRKSMLIDDSNPFLDELNRELASTVDESYFKFLKSVRVTGKTMFVITDDTILEYGKENTVAPHVPGKSAKDGVPCKEPEFQTRKPQKCHQLHMDEDDLACDDVHSEYEKKLMKVINMPYDEKEYRVKHGLATEHKQMQRTKETRRRSVTFDTEELSPSYLDHYPELKKMVNSAVARRDTCRALLLLRCLFFYNENVAQEGSFLPWKNPSFVRQVLGPA